MGYEGVHGKTPGLDASYLTYTPFDALILLSTFLTSPHNPNSMSWDITLEVDIRMILLSMIQ